MFARGRAYCAMTCKVPWHEAIWLNPSTSTVAFGENAPMGTINLSRSRNLSAHGVAKRSTLPEREKEKSYMRGDLAKLAHGTALIVSMLEIRHGNGFRLTCRASLGPWDGCFRRWEHPIFFFFF